MGNWNPGDLCQVRRGKRWVDAEVDTMERYGRNVRVVLEDGHRVRADAANIRPRPGKRGKLPEPTIALSEAQVREALEEGRQVRRELEEKFRCMRHTEPDHVKAGRKWSEVSNMPEPNDNSLRHSDGTVVTRPKGPPPREAIEVVLKPVPKPTTARSEAYLAHVRRHPCCSCGTTEAIHAHHVASGGMGQKASDYLTAPLCWSCHQHWHATATLPGEEPDQSKWTLWEAAARCLEEWITREMER